MLLLALELNLDRWLVPGGGEDLEGPCLHVALHGGVGELAPDEPLGVEDGVLWVANRLVFSALSDESLVVGERDVGGRRARPGIVGDDVDVVILPDTNARVRGAKIDAHGDSGGLVFLFRHG
mmetsp:Transcript_15473/g.29387  ORF Transcript_15473/g.29387 Transcript_15473/m.29387 type:complete len:122 (+) Transcript_15473:595-960(+)